MRIKNFDMRKMDSKGTGNIEISLNGIAHIPSIKPGKLRGFGLVRLRSPTYAHQPMFTNFRLPVLNTSYACVNQKF